MAETSSYGRVSKVTRVGASRVGGSGSNIFEKMIPVMISMNKGIDTLCEKVQSQLNVLDNVKDILMQQLDISKKQLENSNLTLKLAEQERDAAREALYESRFGKKQKIPERVSDRLKTDSDIFSSIKDFITGLGLGFLRALGPMLLALAGLGKYVMALKLPKSIALLMKGLKILKDSFLKVFDIASDIFKFLGKIGSRITGVFLKILEFIPKLLKNLSSVFIRILSFASDIGATLFKLFKSILKSISSISKALLIVFGNMLALADDLGKAIKSTFLKTISVLGDVGKFIGESFNRIVKSIREMDLMDDIAKFGSRIKNALFSESGVFGKVVKFFREADLLGDAKTFIINLKNTLFAESGILGRVITTLKNVDYGLLGRAAKDISSLLKITRDAVVGENGFFTKLSRSVKELDIIDDVNKFTSNIKNTLFGENGFFTKLTKSVKELNIVDNVSTFTSNLKNAIFGENGLLTRLFKSIKELNLVDNVSTFASNLKNTLFGQDSVFDRVVKSISQIDLTENAKALATNIKNVFVGETGIFTKIQNLFSADGAIGKAFTFIIDIGTSVGNVISDSFAGIKNLFFGESGAISKIKNFFGPDGPLSFLGNLFSADGAFSKFFRIITDLFPFIKWLTGPLAIAIFTLIDFATGFMKGFDEGGLIGGIKEGTLEVIRGIFTKPLDLLKDLASWIAEKLGFEQFSQFLDNFSFTATFDDFVKRIETAFSSGGILSAIETGLVGVLDVLVAKPINLVKDIVSWIANKLGFSSISKSLDSFSFTDVFTNVSSAASNAIKSAIKSEIPGGLYKYLPDSLTKWLSTESKMTPISSAAPATTETPAVGAAARVKAATTPSSPATTPPTATKPQVDNGFLNNITKVVGGLAETGKQNLTKVGEFANIAFSKGAEFAAPIVEAVKGGINSIGGAKDLVVNSLVSAGVTSKKAIANILSQVWAESKFVPKSENLNYSAEGLMKKWPTRFPTIEVAKQYESKPQKIAEKVYGNRMGNTAAGDGWKYRGRGFIQITGKDAYAQASKYLGIDLVSNPDKANEPMIAARLIPWFFLSYKRKQANELESADTVNRAVGFVGSKDTTSVESMKRKEVARQIEAAMSGPEPGTRVVSPPSTPTAVPAQVTTPTQQAKPVSAPVIVPPTPRTGTNLNEASVGLTTVNTQPVMPVVINNVDNSTKNNTSILGGMGSSRNRENSFLDIIDYNWKHTYY